METKPNRDIENTSRRVVGATLYFSLMEKTYYLLAISVFNLPTGLAVPKGLRSDLDHRRADTQPHNAGCGSSSNL